MQKKKKTLKTFVRENRAELTAYIRGQVSDPEYPVNDAEREDWVLNDETLYNWALSDNVDLGLE